MKALVLQEFGTMSVAELPDPVAQPGEVLIRVIATGICGSDIHGFTGENGRRTPGQVMGHESVGRIEALGKGSAGEGLQMGRLVTFNPVVVPESDLAAYAGREQHSPGKYVIGVRPDLVSAFAQLITVPVRNVVPLPDDLPVSYGALIEPLAVAVHAVRRVHAEPGQGVLVVGGGPIGQSVVLALLMAGVTDIVVSEVQPGRRALVEQLGATSVDPTTEPVADQLARILGRLADVTIDAVGTSRTLSDAVVSTAFGGSICLVGMGSPALELDAFRISTEERSIVGSFTYSAQDFADAATWIATAPAVAAQLVSREVPLDAAGDAFSALAAGDGTAGKVLVRLDR